MIEKIIFVLLYLVIKPYFRFIHYRADKVKGYVSSERIKNKGENVRFNGFSHIVGADNIRIGRHSRIGRGCHFNGLGGIVIGDNCQVSRNVTIYSSNHNTNGRTIPYDDTYVLAAVNIGDSVWIGMNVSILPGVTIGEGSIIGMNTVISKDVEPFSIVVGSKQRCVGQRDKESYVALKCEGMYFGSTYPEL
jgi:acetyltransferase-like isoleucine patch superfamily enzyme